MGNIEKRSSGIALVLQVDRLATIIEWAMSFSAQFVGFSLLVHVRWWISTSELNINSQSIQTLCLAMPALGDEKGLQERE